MNLGTHPGFDSLGRLWRCDMKVTIEFEVNTWQRVLEVLDTIAGDDYYSWAREAGDVIRNGLRVWEGCTGNCLMCERHIP